MPKCPKCGNEIACLINKMTTETMQTCVFEAGCVRADYEVVSEREPKGNVFECPTCHAELFYDEDDANDFLLKSDEEGDEYGGKEDG